MKTTEEHLKMQYIPIALSWTYSKRNLKSHRKQKYNYNICRIQPCDSIMCGYFCMGFIEFMLKGKILLDYPNLFSPKKYEKNDKIILKYFQ